MLYPNFFSIKSIILRSIFIEFINIYECIIYIFMIITHKAKGCGEFTVYPYPFALQCIPFFSLFHLFLQFFIFLQFCFHFLIIFFTFLKKFVFVYFFNIDVIEN
jgi:hypothetical protein